MAPDDPDWDSLVMLAQRLRFETTGLNGPAQAEKVKSMTAHLSPVAQNAVFELWHVGYSGGRDASMANDGQSRDTASVKIDQKGIEASGLSSNDAAEVLKNAGMVSSGSTSAVGPMNSGTEGVVRAVTGTPSKEPPESLTQVARVEGIKELTKLPFALIAIVCTAVATALAAIYGPRACGPAPTSSAQPATATAVPTNQPSAVQVSHPTK